MESINTPKLDSHYYLFIGRQFINNVTQFWCCFMSEDRVRLLVEASVVSVSSSLVFLWKFYSEDVYLRPLPYNNENTDSRSISIV